MAKSYKVDNSITLKMPRVSAADPGRAKSCFVDPNRCSTVKVHLDKIDFNEHLTNRKK